MDLYLIILSIAVLILYMKWILIFIIYPFQIFEAKFRKNRDSNLLLILAAPSLVIHRLTKGGWARYALYHIAMIPSVTLRGFMYRGLGAEIGKKAVFHFRTEIRSPHFLKIGQGTIIGDNVILDARCRLTIGRNVNFSSNVSIYTQQHDHRDPFFSCPDPLTTKMSVEIDDRAWIGSNVVILPGVHIGEGAVCCAGCVVTKDVAPYTVVAGIPAKAVGERPKNLRYEFSGKSCWFY